MKLDDKDKKAWNPAFDRGDVTDCRLSEPLEKFESKFVIVDDIPVYSKGSNPDKLFEAIKDQITDVCDPVYNLRTAHEQAGIKEDFKITIEKFDVKLIDFYCKKKCAEKQGLNIIRREEYEIGLKCANDLLNCEVPRIKRMFHPVEGFKATGQEEIYYTFGGCPCKIKIDIKLIDEKRKIIQLIDIKTSGNWTSNFIESFKQFGYAYQAEFYHMIYANCNEFSEYRKLGYKLSDTFDFCVVSTLPNGGGSPLYYTYKVGNEEVTKNIYRAMAMYKLCTEHGKSVNKQSYYELLMKLDYPLKLEA